MQKDANLVELEKCCQTHIFLQNFVLIQPRTSPPKICKILPLKELTQSWAMIGEERFVSQFTNLRSNRSVNVTLRFFSEHIGRISCYLCGPLLNRSQKPSSMKLYSTLFSAVPVMRFFEARILTTQQKTPFLMRIPRLKF